MLIRLLLYFMLGLFLIWFFNGGLEKIMTPPSDLSSIPEQQKPYQKTPTAKPLTPSMAKAQEREARLYLNRLRQSVQLTPLQYNTALSNAAHQHASYSSLNNIQSHEERPNLPGFSGQTPTTRAFTAGYQSPVAEVIAYNHRRPHPFIDDLMSAIYHRLSLLSMTQDQIGIGIAGDGKGTVNSSLTALLGNQTLNALCQSPPSPQPGTYYYQDVCQNNRPVSKRDYDKALNQVAKQNPKLIVWPKPGGDVSPVFYEESPDPLPECNVSGYPVHLQINPIYAGRIELLNETFKVFEQKNGEMIPIVPQTIFDNQSNPVTALNALKAHLKSSSKKDRWIAFFPKHRLNWNSHYQAEIQYKEDGQRKTKRWQFTTQNQPGLVTFTAEKGQQQTLNIKKGQTYTLYFPPSQCKMASTIVMRKQIPKSIDVSSRFIDGETIQVTLNAAPFGGAFSIAYGPSQTLIRFEIETD
ncbi:CAP domain-containing protein [Hydrogenovibrio sp. 3SP14C1]|uniref:CAP domain-containing protein n=1 Tax=Hydrogenovibrio sp. 3SP14C1 TaxID=3038774 RepID=UPI002416131A|nr:CAP domain-containing protein [Hydrogenovibrio sp. 3SP14C1]MDG4811482.1 CAP domain-containing protein [Hydrogenovibrio sp. 3SP14C1]